jgi:hypothetical protein
MRINWKALSVKSGVPVETLLARYGQEPVSFLAVATIVIGLGVMIRDVLDGL